MRVIRLLPEVALYAALAVLFCSALTGCGTMRISTPNTADSGTGWLFESGCAAQPKKDSPPSGSRVEDSQEPSGQDPAGPEGGTSP